MWLVYFFLKFKCKYYKVSDIIVKKNERSVSNYRIKFQLYLVIDGMYTVYLKN